jgi:hypothetical protein
VTELAFEAFPKIPRLKKGVVITEKIDGTNAQIALFSLDSAEAQARALEDHHCLHIFPGQTSGDSALALYAGSRSRWIRPEKSADNFGFAAWVVENRDELVKLGPGRHYGEWYGLGIQSGYGLDHRRFALFNVARWNPENPNKPACCEVVPVLPTEDADEAMQMLHENGSYASSGFKRPEGIVVYHSGSRQLYKRTFENDGGKWLG